MPSFEPVLACLELDARAAWLRDAETYLAEATDHADLENRIRQIERRGWYY